MPAVDPCTLCTWVKSVRKDALREELAFETHQLYISTTRQLLDIPQKTVSIHGEILINLEDRCSHFMWE